MNLSLVNYVMGSGFLVYFLKITLSYRKLPEEFKKNGLQGGK